MKIRNGAKVMWTCSPRNYDIKPFECKGIVTGLQKSTFGGCREGMGAIIKVTSKKYHNTYNKKTTFVSIEKLQLA
jgi:hypothetical protein